MMISPETYYENNLKGKTVEQLLSIIRGLKQKSALIDKLKFDRGEYGLQSNIAETF